MRLKSKHPWETVVRNTRIAAISFACAICMLATVSICLPGHAEGQARRTAQDEKIDGINDRIKAMDGYGDRITRVEDQNHEIAAQLNEITTWARGIGLALCGALIERVLRLRSGAGKATEEKT